MNLGISNSQNSNEAYYHPKQQLPRIDSPGARRGGKSPEPSPHLGISIGEDPEADVCSSLHKLSLPLGDPPIRLDYQLRETTRSTGIFEE